jgi:RNA polymerase sigma factor (sigma-70 family)
MTAESSRSAADRSVPDRTIAIRAELAARFLAGDDGAFDDLARDRRPELWRIARRHGLDQDEADDVAHACLISLFVRVRKRTDRPDPRAKPLEAAGLGAFLRRSAANKSIDHIRKTVRLAAADPEVEPAGHDPATGPEAARRSAVAGCLDELRTPERAVLLRKYHLEETWEEVARQLGTTVRHARHVAQHGKRRLQDCLRRGR